MVREEGIRSHLKVRIPNDLDSTEVIGLDTGVVESPVREIDAAMALRTESPAIEAGKVYVPKDATWLAAFHREVVLFPKGKYDDQIDSMSQFLRWARHRQPAMQQLTCIVTPIYLEPPDLPF